MTMEPTPAEFTRDPLLRAVGALLRSYREGADLSRPKLAAALGCTPQWLELIETGKKPISEQTARDLDTYFKTPNQTFWTMWREVKREGRHLTSPPGFQGFVRKEAIATWMNCFEAQLIPGLLQTREYADALMNVGQPADDLDALISQRVDRQAILNRETPPRLSFVVDEAALRRPVGGPKVMREQLEHLLDVVSSHPNVQVRVLPFDSVTWAGLDGAFTVLGLPDSTKLAYLESIGLGQLISDPHTVEATQVRFGLVTGEALPRNASRKMISQALEGYT
ncbi:hypothetical protein DPM19_22960 [Actinomadura craniellae]|uniref:HTH cro/C1-type domain-containing protein n=1 Tax=Actinomadura craniellae TaxID=2231787 RepID=A0A365H1G7_9ACTN|nr:helix-turn-helix transcriptional regulator [Actinomadura craniellae]RAY12878.1 hypothetical protein DPM19_22960 [Actinomadura craniellae]